MVEQIEEFAAQLELSALVIDSPRLAKRHVVINQTAGLQCCRIAYHVTPRSIGRRYERRRIEPLRRGPVIDVGAANLVRKLRLASKDSADIFIVARNVGGEWHAAMKAEDVGELPAGNNA